MKKIKAVTILEVTVSMLLACIVVAFTYGGLTMFTTLYNDYQRKTIKHEAFTGLQTHFYKDIKLANTLEKQYDGFKAVHKDKIVEYKATSDHLLRICMGVTDTFFVSPEIECHWKGEEQNISGELVDLISIKCGTDFLELVATKEYPAATHINKNAAHGY